MIDEALNTARSRVNAGVPSTEKIAAAYVDDGLTKEASELANALEYVALNTVDDGSAAGSARSSVVRDFFKQATGEQVSHGAVKAVGIQQLAASQSKRKLNPKGIVPGDKPAVSEAPEGEMSDNVLAQTKAAEASLYEILMGSKTAAHGGPAEFDSEMNAPGIPSGNENQNRKALLSSNSAPVSATKRQAKMPTRARLAEVFANAGNTTDDASAVFPRAAKGAGGAKIASIEELVFLSKLAGKAEKIVEEAAPKAEKVVEKIVEKATGKPVVQAGEKAVAEGAGSWASRVKPTWGKAGIGAGVLAAGLGARKIHQNSKRLDSMSQKTASALGEYSNLFDVAASGALGDDTRSALDGILGNYEESSFSTKEASVTVTDDTDDRQARLAELLHRHQSIN